MNLSLLEYKIKRIFGLLIFGEIFLMGSGQFLLISGGLTLKMFNYALMLTFAAYAVFCYRIIEKDTFLLTGWFTALLLLGTLLSVVNDGWNKLFTDLSPLFYFYTIIFFDLYFRTFSDIVFIERLLKISAISLAGLYLIYILLIAVGFFNFDLVYLFMEDSSDIMFRGKEGALFYKGFIYLAIGLVFYISRAKMLSWQSLLLMAAIYFTHTRAFVIIVLCACCCYILYWLYIRCYRVPLKYVIWSISLLLLVLLFSAGWYENFIGEDRQGGDLVRLETIKQVMEQVTPVSFFIGHGFGIGVPIRPIHMEMSYMEIFHKQGIAGLVFWGYLLLRSCLFFFSSSLKQQIQGLPFLLSILVIYIQSLFNPFLNNPIGMGFVLISYVVLKRIRKLDCEGNTLICTS